MLRSITLVFGGSETQLLAGKPLARIAGTKNHTHAESSIETACIFDLSQWIELVILPTKQTVKTIAGTPNFAGDTVEVYDHYY